MITRDPVPLKVPRAFPIHLSYNPDAVQTNSDTIFSTSLLTLPELSNLTIVIRLFMWHIVSLQQLLESVIHGSVLDFLS